MNKKIAALFSVIIILTFIGYIVYDSFTNSSETTVVQNGGSDLLPEENWLISAEMSPAGGPLLAVATDERGNIYLGGESFVSCLDSNLSEVWSRNMDSKIAAICASGDTVFAASSENIFLISARGKILDEWGPYEANSLITSISANKKYVAFADAGIKRVFVLKKNGEVSSMMGQAENKFIIPSPYFDVSLSDKELFIANTGNRRVERWTPEGMFIDFFGEPGTAPGAFCGCCNPAHFTFDGQGFVTAEKGINRIKILDQNGKFVEFVSSRNNFTASVPLDIASSEGKFIYAVDPVSSKLYVFKHK